MALQIYDQLLQFPLFLGMSRDDLSQVAAHTKFDFVKEEADKVLIANDTACTSLCLLLTGTVSVETRSDDGSYTLTEQLTAPVILQPEALFGYCQRYTQTFRTMTAVSVLRLERREVFRLSEEFLIFRINLLNLLATQAQKKLHQPWRRRPENLEDRLVRFVADRCLHPAGPKTLHILMTQLAAEVGDSRLDVSHALNALQDKDRDTSHGTLTEPS